MQGSTCFWLWPSTKQSIVCAIHCFCALIINGILPISSVSLECQHVAELGLRSPSCNGEMI